MRDLKLEKAGELLSMNNLHRGEVKEKKEDMDLAFAHGLKLSERI
jgi:hypothetical protein